ncbi:hypothetical protein BDR26DRAFT_860700 [Obelidium mucronatum]|nr:hypothetical protein BDR26DRAFT_860700 [Obelidium mucronatum]
MDSEADDALFPSKRTIQSNHMQTPVAEPMVLTLKDVIDSAATEAAQETSSTGPIVFQQSDVPENGNENYRPLSPVEQLAQGHDYNAINFSSPEADSQQNEPDDTDDVYQHHQQLKDNEAFRPPLEELVQQVGRQTSATPTPPRSNNPPTAQQATALLHRLGSVISRLAPSVAAASAKLPDAAQESLDVASLHLSPETTSKIAQSLQRLDNLNATAGGKESDSEQRTPLSRHLETSPSPERLTPPLPLQLSPSPPSSQYRRNLDDDVDDYNPIPFQRERTFYDSTAQNMNGHKGKTDEAEFNDTETETEPESGPAVKKRRTSSVPDERPNYFPPPPHHPTYSHYPPHPYYPHQPPQYLYPPHQHQQQRYPPHPQQYPPHMPMPYYVRPPLSMRPPMMPYPPMPRPGGPITGPRPPMQYLPPGYRPIYSRPFQPQAAAFKPRKTYKKHPLPAIRPRPPAEPAPVALGTAAGGSSSSSAGLAPAATTVPTLTAEEPLAASFVAKFQSVSQLLEKGLTLYQIMIKMLPKVDVAAYGGRRVLRSGKCWDYFCPVTTCCKAYNTANGLRKGFPDGRLRSKRSIRMLDATYHMQRCGVPKGTVRPPPPPKPPKPPQPPKQNRKTSETQAKPKEAGLEASIPGQSVAPVVGSIAPVISASLAVWDDDGELSELSDIMSEDLNDSE